MWLQRRESGHHSCPIGILECKRVDGPGESVRCFVVADRLEQVGTDLNGVIWLLLHDTRFRLPDELAVYFQIHLAVGIPLGFETGGTLMENVGSNHGGLAVHAGDKTELSLVEIDAVPYSIAAVSANASGRGIWVNGTSDGLGEDVDANIQSLTKKK